MLTLPAAITSHIADDPYLACHLIELQGSVVHRWTDAPIDLTYGGNTYLSSAPFSVGDIFTGVDGEQLVSIVFDEQTQQIQGYDLAEGMKDRTITIWEAWIDPADKKTVLAVQVICGPGTTEGIDFDEQDAAATGTLTIRPQFAGIAGGGPRNTYQLSCINGYKDARCKYVGALTTCDHTFTDCVAHSNQLNFRGCRHAVTAPKTITWGNSDVQLNRPVVNYPTPTPQTTAPPPGGTMTAEPPPPSFGGRGMGRGR